VADTDVWAPGSFTKNFAWGADHRGLVELHSIIRRGFADSVEDVPRKLFRERVPEIGDRVLVALNFFLFNRTLAGEDMVLADEMVFQAMSWEHGVAFDRVALFAFLFSRAGRWRGAKPEQRRPAMWANAYILEQVSKNLKWDQDRITSSNIQSFINDDRRYRGKTIGKLASNLNYLLHIGRVQDFGEQRVSRWWVDCLFLALDRLTEDALIDGKTVEVSALQRLLTSSEFLGLTGGKTIEKELAVRHLTRLYGALGGRRRLSDAAVIEKTLAEIPDAYPALPNDTRPRGAVHLTNPKILKSIPPVCADLARHAGFDVVSPDEMEVLQAEEFIRLRTDTALAVLREKGIKPTMSLEELLTITRGR